MAKKIGFVGIKFCGWLQIKKIVGINFRSLVNNNNKNKVITLEVTKSKNIFRSAKKFYTILTQRKKFGNKISRLAQNKNFAEIKFCRWSGFCVSRELNCEDDPKNREIREI